MSIKFTNQSSSQLFQDFRSIHPANYRKLVRFYEKNEQDLTTLSDQEHFIILCYYTNALFSLRDYEAHLVQSQKVLERSIYYNISEVDSVDIYTFTLHQKAVSHFQTNDTATSRTILEQLIRIDAPHNVYLNLLKRCLLAERPLWVRKTLGLSLCLFIITAVYTLFQSFLIEPFYPEHAFTGLIVQLSILSTGIMTAATVILGHYYRTNRYIQKIAEAALQK